MKQFVMGIVAHVDAGKTTLSEAMLYQTGTIRKLGRVDKKDSFLDQYSQERERGITIFSKQAKMQLDDTEITLLDTPGHVDFSAEMERTLRVLDAAVLVISAPEGVQAHTRTLWRLLKQYHIPVFLFVNKMDQCHQTEEEVLTLLKDKLDGSCISFQHPSSEDFLQNAALCDEELMNYYLENDRIEEHQLSVRIAKRKMFPCYFGSALKLVGVTELLEGMIRYWKQPLYSQEFGARVFKITSDPKGNRLTHLKMTGGILRAKSMLKYAKEGQACTEEKVNEIRCYSGDRFELVPEITAGSICTVTGLSQTFAGQGLGFETDFAPILEPVLSYSVFSLDGTDKSVIMQKLQHFEQEEPLMHVKWNEETQEINVQVMGEVQIEIWEKLLKERYDISVKFDKGSICYRETICNSVEGVGHYEPLRHYAEVHLLMEPGREGSGIVCECDCKEEVLGRHWQRLILSHLYEKEHRGVLIGAPVTDIRITIKSGRAHIKHTEGGDFREATYRAVRQGLMEAQSCLLEPYGEFVLEVPEGNVGRAMNDLEQRKATFELLGGAKGVSVLQGTIPLATAENYGQEVLAYTKGLGVWECTYLRYGRCHNEEEVLRQHPYDPEHDLANSPDSVFCEHGAGTVVPWNQVKKYMHLESCLQEHQTESEEEKTMMRNPRESMEYSRDRALGTEEVDAIIERSVGANRKENKRDRRGWKLEGKTVKAKASPAENSYEYRPKKRKDSYILVDGYNVIFAWKELQELAKETLDGARGRLQDILCNYQAVKGCPLIVVFDAYRLEGHKTEVFSYHNIQVVFTKEAETADQYIERFAHQNAKQYEITVVTSDGLEQIIILGQGCLLKSAREFEQEVRQTAEETLESFHRRPDKAED